MSHVIKLAIQAGSLENSASHIFVLPLESATPALISHHQKFCDPSEIRCTAQMKTSVVTSLVLP